MKNQTTVLKHPQTFAGKPAQAPGIRKKAARWIAKVFNTLCSFPKVSEEYMEV